MPAFADGALKLEFIADRAILTLDRPEKRNALSQAMWQALPEAVAAVEAEAGAKLLIVTGAAGHFAAGADISEFDVVYADRAASGVYARAAYEGVEAVGRLSKPSIAMIRGACVGGGMAIALACDLRLAATNARLGITPAKLGIMYNLADTKRLVETVGPSAAKDILFTGRIMGADEALGLRLVDTVHAPEALKAAVLEKAAAICANSQWTTRKAKALVRMILNGASDDDAATRAWFLDAVEGEDFKEGRAAFMAKRTPNFTFR